MKRTILVGAAAVLAFAGPLWAKPGNGHGRGQYNGYAYYGGPAYEMDGAVGYGVGGCPPGLAKKDNGCLPPGQAQKMLRGEHFRYSVGTRYRYRRNPHGFRAYP